MLGSAPRKLRIPADPLLDGVCEGAVSPPSERTDVVAAARAREKTSTSTSSGSGARFADDGGGRFNSSTGTGVVVPLQRPPRPALPLPPEERYMRLQRLPKSSRDSRLRVRPSLRLPRSRMPWRLSEPAGEAGSRLPFLRGLDFALSVLLASSSPSEMLVTVVGDTAVVGEAACSALELLSYGQRCKLRLLFLKELKRRVSREKLEEVGEGNRVGKSLLKDDLREVVVVAGAAVKKSRRKWDGVAGGVSVASMLGSVRRGAVSVGRGFVAPVSERLVLVTVHVYGSDGLQ